MKIARDAYDFTEKYYSEINDRLLNLRLRITEATSSTSEQCISEILDSIEINFGKNVNPDNQSSVSQQTTVEYSDHSSVDQIVSVETYANDFKKLPFGKSVQKELEIRIVF